MNKKEFQENLKVRKALKKQLKDFRKAKDYLRLYDPYIFTKDVYLLRFFRFFPPKEFRTQSNILRKNTIQGGQEYTMTTEWDDSVVMPFAKVIKAGIVLTMTGDIDEDAYGAGDIIILHSDKVLGSKHNPAFDVWESYNKGAGYQVETKPPPATVQSIELNFGEYRFLRAGNIHADENDIDTYLLNSHEVQGEFLLDEYLKT